MAPPAGSAKCDDIVATLKLLPVMLTAPVDADTVIAALVEASDVTPRPGTPIAVPAPDVAKLIRNKEIVYEGKIGGLKRFKDDVREVNEGVECGISLERHDDIKEGDLIELYQIEKVARRLDSKRP